MAVMDDLNHHQQQNNRDEEDAASTHHISSADSLQSNFDDPQSSTDHDSSFDEQVSSMDEISSSYEHESPESDLQPTAFEGRFVQEIQEKGTYADDGISLVEQSSTKQQCTDMQITSPFLCYLGELHIIIWLWANYYVQNTM